MWESLVQKCRLATPPDRTTRRRRDSDQAPVSLTCVLSTAVGHGQRFVALCDLHSISPGSTCAGVAMRCCRIRSVMSQDRLGYMVGIEKEIVQAIESGAKFPPRELWSKFVDILQPGSEHSDA
jgi:DNA-binding XRE family transcriptional regulator